MVALLASTAMLGVVGLAAPTSLPQAHADTTVFLDDDAVSMDVENGTVYYSTTGGCPLVGEFPTHCRIRRLHESATSSLGYIEWANPDSPGPADLASNIAVGDDYIYWANKGGELTRKPRAAYTWNEQLLVNPLVDPAARTQVATDDLYIYWTENSSDGTGRLYRTAGPGARVDLLVENNRHLEDLQVDGYGGVLYVTIRPLFFLCCLDVLERVTVDVAGEVHVDRSDVQGIQAYSAKDGLVHFIDAFAGGDPKVRVAPVEDLAADVTLATLDGADDPTFTAIARAGDNLYFQPLRNAGGPIMRMPRTGGTPQPITDNLDRVRHLASTPTSLFALASGQVLRIDLDSAGTFLDVFGARAPEVVQILQSDSHDVPLLEGRRTFVRAFGNLASVDAPGQTLNLTPMALLHGTRGGVPLPGSPLRPVSGDVLDGTLIDRTNMDTTYLFELPYSWRNGTITLRSTFNESRGVVELDHTNNEASRTIAFQPTRGLCFDMLPVLTQAGVSEDAWDPATAASYERALTLLPVDHIRRIYRGGTPRTLAGTLGDHYNMFDGDHTNMLLANLNAEMGWQGAPAACGDHVLQRVVYVPEAGRFGKAFGIGPYFFALMQDNTGDSNWDQENEPRGGVSGLAHEAGHNLGFAHVLCPTMGEDRPAWPHESVPHDSCSIGSTNDHVGFDPMTRMLILPVDAAGMPNYAEFMSYAQPLWLSRYTFDKIFNQFVEGGAAVAGVAGSGAGASEDPGSIVTGFVSDDGSVVLAEVSTASGAPMAALRERIADPEVVEESPDFEVRTFDTTGALVASMPLLVSHATTEGSETVLAFMNVLDPDPAVSRIAIVSTATGDVLAEHDGGDSAPTITIDTPIAGDVVGDTMAVTWTSADADGDDLVHLVRYSNDGGTSWQVITSLLPGDSLDVDMTTMPGGTDAFLEVVASDGVHSTSARVGPFTVGEHAPETAILSQGHDVLDLASPATMAQSDQLVLRGWGYDAEDGELGGDALAWEFVGPITHSATGNEVHVADLPPGTYDVTLSGTDASGLVGTSSTTLHVLAKAVAGATVPGLDGSCADAAYAADDDPITLRLDDGNLVGVAVVHAGGDLWACATGLLGEADDDATFSFGVDADASGDAVPGAEDVLVRVAVDGRRELAVGDGSGGFTVIDPGSILDVETSWNGPRWSAEIRLGEDVAELGGLIRLFAGHQKAGAGAGAWPTNAIADGPGTWGLANLGDSPPTLTLPAAITVTADGPDGAVVDYLVTAQDAEDAAPEVACVPASGSLFPIGVTTVDCTATDTAGHVVVGAFTVTVNTTTRIDKLGVREDLADMVPTGDAEADAAIEEAIGHLDVALDEALWVDGERLTPDGGKTVFDGERDAVEVLLGVADPPTGLSDLLLALTAIDRSLATTALGDAETAVVDHSHGDPDDLEQAHKSIARARKELDRGDHYLAEDRPVQAINRYRQAWFRAQQAIAQAQSATAG